MKFEKTDEFVAYWFDHELQYWEREVWHDALYDVKRKMDIREIEERNGKNKATHSDNQS